MRVLAVTAAALALAGLWCVGCGSGTTPVTPGGSGTYVISPQAAPLVLTAGQRVNFTAALQPSATGEAVSATEPVTLAWSAQGDIGSINAQTGVFTATETASSSSPKTGTIKVTSTKGTGTLTVRVGVSLSAIARIVISYPSNVQLNALNPGQAVQFSAVGEDMFGNRSVGARLLISPTWTCDAALGTIDTRGRFVARLGQQTTPATGTVTASLAGVGGMVTESVSLTVNFPAQLSATPTTLAFGDNLATKTFQIANLGSKALTWTASETTSWMSLSATSGSAPKTVTVTVDRTGLAPGSDYAGTITVLGSDGRTSEVNVTMAVTAVDVDISSTGEGSR
jgi:hypothetical protein